MSHVARSRKKLLDRVRRLEGQVRAAERALERGAECDDVMQILASCRGAVDALLGEVVEGHVREHLAAPGLRAKEREKAAGELIRIVRAYLK
jgi:DNA-binding FrmR family transcriptional regulator